MTEQFLSQSVETLPADAPLWLIVQRGGRRQHFEFPSQIDHAIVVGSAQQAHVWIDNTAPIVLYLEREGQSLWLTPAYAQSGLRMDSIPVTTRQRVARHAVVEFLDVRVTLQIPETSFAPSLDSTRTSEIRISPPDGAGAPATPDRPYASPSSSVGEALPSAEYATTAISIPIPEMGSAEFNPGHVALEGPAPRTGTTQPFAPFDVPLVGMPIIDITA